MIEVNYNIIKTTYLFSCQISTLRFCVFDRYECCPPRLENCQMRHINIQSGEHMLTAQISEITQRHLHRHLYMYAHTHSLSWGCVISQSCLSAVLWSPQRSLMITLSLLLSSAFSQKMRTHTFCLFIYTSFTPRHSGSLGINFFQMFSCFPHPKMKERRSTMLGNEKEKRMKEESTKEK